MTGINNIYEFIKIENNFNCNNISQYGKLIHAVSIMNAVNITYYKSIKEIVLLNSGVYNLSTIFSEVMKAG